MQYNMRKYFIYMTILLLLLSGVVGFLYAGPLMHLRFPGVMWMVILPWLLTMVCGLVLCRKLNKKSVPFVSLFINQLGIKFLIMLLLLVVIGYLFIEHIKPALLTLFFSYIVFLIAEYIWVYHLIQKSRKDGSQTLLNCSQR